MNVDGEVTAARRGSKGAAVGLVVVALQATRLDAVCQLRIFAPLDEVFALLGEEAAAAEVRVPEADVAVPRGVPLWISSGPLQGFVTVAEKTEEEDQRVYVPLRGGYVLGTWWGWPCEPLSVDPVPQPQTFTETLAAAARTQLGGALTSGSGAAAASDGFGLDSAWLDGVYEGSAVLLKGSRFEHPTASPDRAQHLRLCIARGVGGGSAAFSLLPQICSRFAFVFDCSVLIRSLFPVLCQMIVTLRLTAPGSTRSCCASSRRWPFGGGLRGCSFAWARPQRAAAAALTAIFWWVSAIPRTGSVTASCLCPPLSPQLRRPLRPVRRRACRVRRRRCSRRGRRVRRQRRCRRGQ